MRLPDSRPSSSDSLLEGRRFELPVPLAKQVGLSGGTGGAAEAKTRILIVAPIALTWISPTTSIPCRPWVITKEETFGPVAPLYRFKTDAEVIELANATEFGLAAYFYARDVGRIFRVSERLEYGIVGANDPLPTGPHIPFGGFKESGLGRENGSMGIDHFLETKAVSIGI